MGSRLEKAIERSAPPKLIESEAFRRSQANGLSSIEFEGSVVSRERPRLVA